MATISARVATADFHPVSTRIRISTSKETGVKGSKRPLKSALLTQFFCGHPDNESSLTPRCGQCSAMGSAASARLRSLHCKIAGILSSYPPSRSISTPRQPRQARGPRLCLGALALGPRTTGRREGHGGASPPRPLPGANVVAPTAAYLRPRWLGFRALHPAALPDHAWR